MYVHPMKLRRLLDQLDVRYRWVADACDPPMPHTQMSRYTSRNSAREPSAQQLRRFERAINEVLRSRKRRQRVRLVGDELQVKE